MKTSLALFILFLFFSISLSAQWKRETGFTIGVIIPDHSLNHSVDGELVPSIKLGFNQSWYKPESKLSFRPAVGLDMERMAVDNVGFGGLGGGSFYKGSIWSINAELALLAQFHITKGLFFAVGPSGKYLVTNYENLTHSWWLKQQSGVANYEGVKETNEFNRKYFLKPSFGVKTMLLKTNLCKKISLGLSFEYQWRSYKEYQEINTYDEIFQYSQTSEISLYFGIH
jgi:hypothetical protein